jgi:hypothetical protein
MTIDEKLGIVTGTGQINPQRMQFNFHQRNELNVPTKCRLSRTLCRRYISCEPPRDSFSLFPRWTSRIATREERDGFSLWHKCRFDF